MTTIANEEVGSSVRTKLNTALAVTDILASVSAFGATIVDDANAAAARTTLGLGTASTAASSAFVSATADANQGVVRRTFYQDFTATFGAITALTGNDETVTITGLLTTDQVHVQCISAPPSGMIIANARVSAADTLEVKIVTAVALGITLGALNFRITIIR